MDFYFVYSSGGGAGDWNGIDRMFKEHMPLYFKDHILLKFGDMFINHRSSKNLIKASAWKNINNAREWIVNNTGDKSLLSTPNLIMDVGTTKIVSFISAHYNINCSDDLVNVFDNLMNQYNIIDKYCKLIKESKIDYAVTFDIPNLFKVRSQIGNVSRNLLSTNYSIIDASAKYANEIFEGIGDASRLLTTINGGWSSNEIKYFFKQLKYTPTKLGIGGLSDERNIGDFIGNLQRVNTILNFNKFERVHFLGCGGLKKVSAIKAVFGNKNNFSVDNTTPYNRSIDGSVDGNAQSGYFDYASKKLTRINPTTKNQILSLHKQSVINGVAHFSDKEMCDIIDRILEHQSFNSGQNTYDARGKLVMHNFDVFKFNAQ